MKRSYNIDNDHVGMRIDRWIRTNLGKLPQGLIEKSLRKGKIKINKRKVKSSYKVNKNDQINIFDFNIKTQHKDLKKKYNPPKKIIKEKENLLIDIFAKSTYFNNTKPYSVHRLDKETSGVFIIAKNRKTAQLLTSLFRLRKVHKTYLAVCHGVIIKNSGELNNDLIRYQLNKQIVEKAKSTYQVLDKNSELSLVKMKPITGRKHQLRKQLFSIGHPINGDDKYNNIISKKFKNKNLLLHSYEIKFMINNIKYTYKASLPEYFKKFLKVKGLFLSIALGS